MFAILSDIHANLEALEAVEADMRRCGVSRVICLGDLLGYGPNPKEVVDRAMGFDIVLRGNHDEAVVGAISNHFRKPVVQAIRWTRSRLRPRSYSGSLYRRRWRWLRSLPLALKVENLLLAHGSPADTFEYVTDPPQFQRIFQQDMDEGEQFCFLGHTHVPAIVVERAGGRVREVPAQPGRWYRVRRRRAIVNVGSVGQPRDGDPRACYLLFRPPDAFCFRRVPYDIERTSDKILATRGLADTFAARLFDGV